MSVRKLITMREALENPAYFANLLGGESWFAWRVLLRQSASSSAS